jgi:hypothetical protein
VAPNGTEGQPRAIVSLERAFDVVLH